MLAERVKEWNRGWREEGRKEGEPAVLARLMGRKFGVLPERDRQRLQEADSETLLHWSQRLLTASSPDKVMQRGEG